MTDLTPDPELLALVGRLAERRGVDAAEAVRQAVREALASPDPGERKGRPAAASRDAVPPRSASREAAEKAFLDLRTDVADLSFFDQDLYDEGPDRPADGPSSPPAAEPPGSGT